MCFHTLPHKVARKQATPLQIAAIQNAYSLSYQIREVKCSDCGATFKTTYNPKYVAPICFDCWKAR